MVGVVFGKAAEVAEAKGALRRVLRQRRRAMGADEQVAASRAMARIVVEDSRWLRASAVAAFASMPGEPDTRPLLEQALRDNKELWLPKVIDTDPPSLTWIRVVQLDQLEAGAFGILEPVERPNVDRGEVERFDLIVIPGLSFDSVGARLGSGRGYYDRALAGVRDRTRPVRMGLCFADFFDPPEGPIPTEPHDVPMHCVATEQGIEISTKNGD